MNHTKQYQKELSILKKATKAHRKRKGKKTIVMLQSKAKGLGYVKFLNSAYWKEVRKRVFQRDNYKCIVCSSTEDLVVHHNSYDHHFSEHKHLKDLDTLCESCHKEYHETVPDFIQYRVKEGI